MSPIGTKQTLGTLSLTSAFDPKRKSAQFGAPLATETARAGIRPAFYYVAWLGLECSGEPMSLRTHFIAGAVALQVAVVYAGPCLAADLDTPATRPPAVSTTEPIHRYGAHNPKCLEWTDGCVVCTKDGCSNTGIACQPKEISCRDTLPKRNK